MEKVVNYQIFWVINVVTCILTLNHFNTLATKGTQLTSARLPMIIFLYTCSSISLMNWWLIPLMLICTYFSLCCISDHISNFKPRLTSEDNKLDCHVQWVMKSSHVIVSLSNNILWNLYYSSLSLVGLKRDSTYLKLYLTSLSIIT